MPRHQDIPSDEDDEVHDTKRAFRHYMRNLFPGATNLDQQLDEMDVIDAIMDEEESSRSSAGKQSKRSRKKGRPEKTNRRKRSPSPAVESSESTAAENSSDSDEDYDGAPVQLNVIFAMGAPLEEEDETEDEDWEDEDEDEEDDNEDDSMDWEPSQKRTYNTRSNARSKTQPKANSIVSTESEHKDSGASVSVSPTDGKCGSAGQNSADSMVSFYLEKGEDAFKEMFTQEVAKRKERVSKQMDDELRKTDRVARRKNTAVFKKTLKKKSPDNSISYFSRLAPEKQLDILKRMEEVNADMHSVEPPKITLLNADIPVEYKSHAMRKLNSLTYMDPSSGEYYKVKQWVEGFMKIPFGKKTTMPVTMTSSPANEVSTFMQNARDQLDGVTYGMEDAKSQIMQLVGQWVSNPDSRGTAIGIKGPMGTGKTTLIKHGVSKILQRPFAFITLGGATDSSYLEGHSYTYEGSVWGQIATILMQSGSMNPVIYFDELDKVSDTAKGQEIVGLLTHLTDTTQNTEFHDKYFAGVDFDLSGALFIFSYNDESLVNPILRDRMHVIETKGYNAADKRTIARQFLIPEVRGTIGFSETDVTIEDDVLDHITQSYTSDENGVRNLKRCLENIYAKLNVSRLAGAESTVMKSSDMIPFHAPFAVTRDVVDNLLKPPTRDVPAHMYV
jgi:ATP-dependent Lon protease